VRLDPEWLRALEPLQPDEVHSVDLSSTSVDDHHLQHLARFTGLRHLHLSKARRIGDAGIAISAG
jgi:hypothetical protein